MEFNEGFNPGQNNHYTEVNLGPNSQYLPGVTELTIINNGTSEDKGSTMPSKKPHCGRDPQSPFAGMSEPDPNKDLTVAKTAILNYISRIAPKLKPEWMQGWERFWTGLLEIDVIENELCDITKQQGTTFNRMFICKIIHHLDRRGFYQDPYNASAMTVALEGDKDHSIRTHGLNWYPDEAVCKRIDGYIETFRI